MSMTNGTPGTRRLQWQAFNRNRNSTDHQHKEATGSHIVRKDPDSVWEIRHKADLEMALEMDPFNLVKKHV